PDGLLRNVPQRQPSAGRAGQIGRAALRVRDGGVAKVFASFERQHVLACRIADVGTIKTEEWLIFLDRLAGVVYEQLPNPAFQFDVDVGQTRFVVPDGPSRADGLLQRRL